MLKSVIIGIDGGTWDVLEPLMQHGYMPNLARITQEGVSGPLRSTLPPITGTAWPTFMTGKGPGYHGCFDWGSLDADYRLRFVNLDRVTSLAFWDVLNALGESVGVVNMPFTYPPRKLDGFMVAGLGTPSLEHTWTYPSWLGERLLSEFGDYPLDKTYTVDHDAALADMVADLVARETHVTDILLWLLDEFDVEHAVMVYTATDRLQHLAMRELATLPPGAGFPDWGIRFYQALDGQIGRVLDRASESTHVMVVSDHGFTTLDKTFYVNDWLRERRLLTTYSPVKRFGHQLGGKISQLARAGRSGDQKATAGFDSTSMLGEVIDWERTKAFSNSHNGIYINSKGRFSHGTVEPGEAYHRLVEDLCAALAEVVDPDTGKPIVEHVYRREDIYEGPYLQEAPDLILEFTDDAFIASRYFLNADKGAKKIQNTAFATPRRGEVGQHHRDGILALMGPAIEQGKKLPDAHLVDMAPTWLHVCGSPIPSDVEGKVLVDAFRPGFIAQNPPQVWDVEQAVAAEKSALSDEESELVYQRLKDLGYLQ